MLFIWEIIKYIKDILIYKSSKKADLYSEDEIANINAISEKVTKEKLVNLIYELSKLETDMKWSTQKTIMFQAGIIKLCSNEFDSSSNIEERVDKIEKYPSNLSRIVLLVKISILVLRLVTLFKIRSEKFSDNT